MDDRRGTPVRLADDVLDFYRRLAAAETAESGQRSTIVGLINGDLREAITRRRS